MWVRIQLLNRYRNIVITLLCFAANVVECGVLVYLYNIERIRSKVLAEKTLDMFRSNPALAQRAESILPGIEKRLVDTPYDAPNALRSIEVLLGVIDTINPDQGREFRSYISRMVDQHVALFSPTQDPLYSMPVMELLPQSPLWNSMFWAAGNAIIEMDMRELIPLLPDPCRLKLRCSSKTTYGAPMAISINLVFPNTNGSITRALEEQMQFYSGKSLTDISASVWSNIRISPTTLHGAIACPLEQEELTIAFDDEGYQSMVLALTLLSSQEEYLGQKSFLQRLIGGSKQYNQWIPAHAPIQWCRTPASLDSNDTDCSFCVSIVDNGTYTLTESDVNGIVECLDAVAQIDPSLSLPPPQYTR
jgi:hypothetical protein